MTALTKRRSQRAPSSDRFAATRDAIAVQTSGYRQGGLRVDWKILDDDEGAELVRLTEEGPGLLKGRQRTKWEALVEKGADAAGIFEDTRQLEQIARDAAAGLRRTARRPFARAEETGVFAELARQVEGGSLHAEHVACAVWILIQMESGLTFGQRCRVERDAAGPVLVVEGGSLIAGRYDEDGNIGARWKKTLEHLEANQWFVVDRHGNEWKIRLGRRAQLAMRAGKVTR